MRDRLIELIKKAKHSWSLSTMVDCDFETWIADYLLENGVIVPHCMVGDTVYVVRNPYASSLTLNKVVEGEVVSIHYHEFGLFTRVLFGGPKINGCRDYNFERELGKTVFLTEEEAERALKGGAE